jgi:hypothetical protein
MPADELKQLMKAIDTLVNGYSEGGRVCWEIGCNDWKRVKGRLRGHCLL